MLTRIRCLFIRSQRPLPILLRRPLSTTPTYTPISRLLRKVPDSPGTLISIAGYVRTIRKQKRIAFASIQDGSCINAVQVVLSPEQAATLSTGSAVLIRGEWVESRGGKEQAFELHATTVSPQGDNDASTSPIQKKYHTDEFLRSLPHLRVRTPHNGLLLRLRSKVISIVTDFFNEREFTQTHTPIITSSDCEGAGEVFTVDARHARPAESAVKPGDLVAGSDQFFGSPKYLTVSAQLHLEALAQGLGNVWTLSPTFRAEKSDTARHLSEFYMLEAEMTFTRDLDQVMDVVESLIRKITRHLQVSSIGQELLAPRDTTSGQQKNENQPCLPFDDLSMRWQGLVTEPWPRITFQDACFKIIEAEASGEARFEVLPDGRTGLQTEHERFLANVLCKGPVFVTNYPRSMKPFYMASSSGFRTADKQEVTTVSCFDLLLPEMCEVAGGSIREHGLDLLEHQMHQDGLLSVLAAKNLEQSEGEPIPAAANLDWYLDLRRYGSVPHGGFGLGFDRLLAYLSGISNVRDMVTFPRHYKRCLC